MTTFSKGQAKSTKRLKRVREHFLRAAMDNACLCFCLCLLFGWYGDHIQVLGLLVIVGLNLAFFLGHRQILLSKIKKVSTALMFLQIILTSLIFPLGPVFLCLNLPFSLALASLFGKDPNGRILLAFAVCFPVIKWSLGWDELLSFSTPVKPALAICTFLTSVFAWFIVSKARERSQLYTQKLSESYKEIHTQNEVIAEKQKKLFTANADLWKISERLSKQEKKEGLLTRNLHQKTGDQRSLVHAIHHDLREPLRNIVSFTQLIERKLSGHPEAKSAIEYLEFAKDGGTRMTAMLDDLLRYTKEEKGEMIPVDLNVLLETLSVDLGDTLQRNRGELKFDELPIVIGDPTQLRQLFQNLISNALKFSRADEYPVVQVLAEVQNERRVNVYVSDNGIGIPDAQLETVFKLFSRASNSESFSGSGIGLSLCKKIGLNHGADLLVESKENIGSTFSIIGLELEDVEGWTEVENIICHNATK